MSTSPIPPVVVTDPGWWLDDVESVYARLREEAPVHRAEPGVLVLSRYEHVREVSRDPARFCSSKGVLVDDPLRAGAPVVGAPSILFMDPPEHVEYRRIVSRAFTPRATALMEERIRELTEQVLAGLDPGDEVEFVETIAAPLPLLVIAELLGMSDADPLRFRVWSDETIKAADGLRADLTIVGEFVQFMQAGIAAHRRTPHEDILGLIVEAEVDGRSLTDDELLIFCMSLLVAGNETTRNLVSGGTVALAERPEQQQWLARHPEGIPTAVEEMLRWVTPVKAFARTATAATELDGVAVDEGDYLVMLYASANRDERAFGPTAGVFDVQRRPDPAHLAFGFGEHLCLGASLARLEARVVFEALLDRFGGITLTDVPERQRSTLINGITAMPVRLGA